MNMDGLKTASADRRKRLDLADCCRTPDNSSIPIACDSF
jgi:hypothetical protein